VGTKSKGDDLFGQLESNLSTSELETGGMQSIGATGIVGTGKGVV